MLRNSRVFSDLKSFPDLGMIFRSILARFGSHFGSILMIKTRSKIDATHRGSKLPPKAEMKTYSTWERETRIFFERHHTGTKVGSPLRETPAL